MVREDPESVSSNSAVESELLRIDRTSGEISSVVSSDNSLDCNDFVDIFCWQNFVDKLSIEIHSDVLDDSLDDFFDDIFSDGDVLSFSGNDFVDKFVDIEIASDVSEDGSFDDDASAANGFLVNCGFVDSDFFGDDIVDMTSVVDDSAHLLTSEKSLVYLLVTTLLMSLLTIMAP